MTFPFRNPLCACVLLAAVVAPCPAPAAARAPVGVQVSGGLTGLEDRTLASYQAAYCYALACLAGMQGDPADQAELLRRAQLADPGSELLAKERASALNTLGRGPEAAAVLASALAAHPQDLGLRRLLASLYRKLGEGARARSLFLGKHGKDPSDPDFLRSLAALDMEDGDFASAERRLRVLAGGKGASLDDRELLALDLQRLSHWKDAEAEYRGVLAKDPGRDTAWGQLADCDQASGDTVSAKADLLAGLKASPQSPLLADQLGRLLYQSGDNAGAVDAFTRLAVLDPGDAHVLFLRGLARLKLGRYRAAESDFRAVGRMQGVDAQQAGALALALLLQKKYSAAGRQLEKLVRLDSGSERAWAELAFVDEHGKRPARAVRALRRGIKALPGDRELILLLAEAQEDAGNLDGAADALRRALALSEDEGVRFELATVLDKLGRFKAAEKELLRVLAEAPRDAEALNYLGYSWADRDEKLAQAEALIRRALAVAPGNPYYLDSLGWTLHRQGRDLPALKDLLRASKRFVRSSDSDEAVVFDHLARVEKKLGRPGEARLAEAQAARIRARARGKSVSADGDEPWSKAP